MYIKRTIKFLLHKRKAGVTENLAIRMRITVSGKTPIDIPTGHNINLDFWDAENEKVISGAVNKLNQTADDINRTIDYYKAKINEVFARYELLEKRVPTPDEIKNLFNDLIGKPHKQINLPIPENDFLKVWDMFVTNVGKQNQWTDETYTKFESLKKHFLNFKNNIKLNEIDDNFLYDFITYMQSPKAMRLSNKNADKGLRNTTISKNVDFIKWFLRWAAKNKYYTGTSHDTFKPRLKGTDGNNKEVIHLSWDELQHVYNFDFINTVFYQKDDFGNLIYDSKGNKIVWELDIESRKALERVRDVFCFCCFTSLRHSDVFKLKRSDVKKDHIKVVTKKTIDGVLIELNKYSKAILDKYKNVNFANNKALPVISLQRMNDHLKTIGQLTGLYEPIRIVYFIGKTRHEEVYPKWMLLTTHCGRRTFIVNSLFLEIPAEVVMKWTGHSDYKSMKPYVKIVDALKVREMKKFDNFNVHENEHD